MTIKIKSTDRATQGDFVVIDRAAYDPQRHELYGDDNDLGAGAGEYVPSIEDLKAAYARMKEQEAQLGAEQDRLSEQGAAQAAEAARLAEQARATKPRPSACATKPPR